MTTVASMRASFAAVTAAVAVRALTVLAVAAVARPLVGALIVAAAAQALAAEPSGEAIFAARCASCHDAPPSADNRAPPKALLKQMSVARIIRTMDFGAMMSLTYMLDRAQREAVAAYLGVPGEDRAPPPSASRVARPRRSRRARRSSPRAARAATTRRRARTTARRRRHCSSRCPS
ncbi:MAG TPA: cytochrome c, partial [Gammaproteobacteria bacterium]|nr:cytochrome c [Gammaproteobacteria bacterium]